MESAEIETTALQVQHTFIDFTCQMENLNRLGSSEVMINTSEQAKPTLKLTKSEKELRMINRNKEALDKRDERIAMQNVDVESSFASSKLPEEKRSMDKQIRACLLDQTDRKSKSINISELLKS